MPFCHVTVSSNWNISVCIIQKPNCIAQIFLNDILHLLCKWTWISNGCAMKHGYSEFDRSDLAFSYLKNLENLDIYCHHPPVVRTNRCQR